MGIKKRISDTIGVSLGGVAIGEANKLPVMGNAVGSVIGAGLVLENMPKKKKGGGF